MSKFKTIPRRTFLKGAGSLIALPFLEAMIPHTAHAQSAIPLRVLTAVFPYGIYQQGFSPSTYGAIGANYAMPNMLSSLNALKSRVILTRGLGLYAVPDGMAHYNALATFMTGPRIASGCDGNLRVGNASAGYKIAQHLRNQNSQLKHMYIGNPQCTNVGNYCDGVGYAPISQRYCDKMEWSGPTTPLSMTTGVQSIFDSLFTGFMPSQPTNTTDPLVAFRRSRGLGVLDSTLDQQAALMAKVGAADKEKLDQYFTAIRETEKAVMASGGGATQPPPQTMTCNPGTRPANGMSFSQEMDVMMNLIVLAFACDRSRVITYTLDTEESGTSRTFDFLGIGRMAHHELSHWNEGSDRIAPFQAVNKFYGDMCGKLLSKMAAYKEGERDILYNSFVVYGSGHCDGMHQTYNLPIVLAGELGGKVKTGQALNLNRMPISNVYLTAMQKLGMSDTGHGDASGVVPGI